MAIQGLSATSVEKKIQEAATRAKIIFVYDPSGKVTLPLQPPFQRTADEAEALAQVQQNRADVLMSFPEDLAQSKSITVYAQDNGIITRGQYNDAARNLVKQSILATVPDPDARALYNSTLKVDEKLYKNGALVDMRFENFVVPIASIALFFLLVILASSSMLLSVSEEKENRMIETMLSVVTPRQLIWGKILGLSGVALTQIAILSALFGAIIAVAASRIDLPIDLSQITVDPVQVLYALYFILAGFLFIAAIMVGVGSAVPSYKEAQQLSSVFIILTVFPIYFVTILLADPSGTIAQIVSYFPFTAPLILLFRNALDAISPLGLALGAVAVAAYVAGGFWLAFKLFELGSLEYTERLSFRRLFGKK